MMGWFKGYGIWSRLLSAFGVTTGLTVMATVTALLVFGRSSAILKVFTREHLPDVVEVAALEQVAGEMIATAPMLLTAPDDTAREVIESDLGRLIEEVTHQMDRLGLAGRETRGEVGALLDGLRKNLLALREAVESRDADEALLVAEIKRLRWLYADLLGELEPLNQDLAYNLDSEVERMIGLSLKGDRSFSALRLRENRKSKDTVEKISSNGIFLVTLMLQAATVGGDEQVETLEALSSDAMDFLKVKLAQLPNDASFLTLRQLFDEIFELADGRDALFAIKKRIHEKERLARTILDDNRELVTRLRGLVDTLVARTQKEALGAADGLAETMGRAQLLLIVMALVALVSSVGVLWFYVRGSIVRRLDALAKGMQALAKGDLKGPIPAVGDDEIGEMAQALTVFKETAEARRKTEKELVQAGKLAALGQLTAGISHELNQPLSALGYYLHNARILLDRGELGMHRENLE
ncbi:MAG: HAMP domain-containing protein, partial [Desulfobacterales bacterium]|nr:HAMP domain-containing protein [Desulfobacterales bacterium]